MSAANVVSTYAKHLEDTLLPAAAATVGVADLNMKVTAAQKGTGRRARLMRMNTGRDEEALEGAALVQLSLRIPRLSEMDEWASMRLEEEILKEHDFSYGKTMRFWIPLKNFAVSPPVDTTGRVRVEPAGSKLWVTRNEGANPVSIHSALRLNLFFDQLRA